MRRLVSAAADAPGQAGRSCRRTSGSRCGRCWTNLNGKTGEETVGKRKKYRRRRIGIVIAGHVPPGPSRRRIAMSWLVIIGLKNAVLVVPLALLAFGVGRFSQRPALAHVLWVVVLVKLLTPPSDRCARRLDAGVAACCGRAASPTGSRPRSRWTSRSCAACCHRQQVRVRPPPPAAATRCAGRSAPSQPTSRRTAAVSSPASANSAGRSLRSPAAWSDWPCAAGSSAAALACLLALRAWRFHRFVRLAARTTSAWPAAWPSWRQRRPGQRPAGRRRRRGRLAHAVGPGPRRAC